ncbi:MAG: hypothetical protein E7G38_15625, partial [Clostridium perfringens]|nr:hypothetical protein [Clostridium perfringens]
MKIKGLKANLIPAIPERLENKLEFRITTELTEEDILLYSTVLIYFDKQLKKDKVNLDYIPKTFAIFTDDGDIEISLSDTVLGINSNIIIYAIKRFEKLNLPEVLKVSVFLEELCHWAWNIEDEVEVKFKIFEIL